MHHARLTILYARWLALALLSITIRIVGLVLVPVALAFAGNGRLPVWARWYDNDREPYGDVARRPGIEAVEDMPNVFTRTLRRMWLRYLWLAIRNPANNFAYLPWVGFPQTADVIYILFGNPNTSDQGEAGMKWTRAWRGGFFGGEARVVAFEVYIVRRWSRTRCLRIRLGWKIDHNNHPGLLIQDGTPAQLVAVVNPFDSFGAQ